MVVRARRRLRVLLEYLRQAQKRRRKAGGPTGAGCVQLVLPIVVDIVAETVA